MSIWYSIIWRVTNFFAKKRKKKLNKPEYSNISWWNLKITMTLNILCKKSSVRELFKRFRWKISGIIEIPPVILIRRIIMNEIPRIIELSSILNQSSLRHFYSNSIKYNLIIPDRNESRNLGYDTMMIQRMMRGFRWNRNYCLMRRSSWILRICSWIIDFLDITVTLKRFLAETLTSTFLMTNKYSCITDDIFNHTMQLKIRKTGLLIVPINSL